MRRAFFLPLCRKRAAPRGTLCLRFQTGPHQRSQGVMQSQFDVARKKKEGLGLEALSGKLDYDEPTRLWRARRLQE